MEWKEYFNSLICIAPKHVFNEWGTDGWMYEYKDWVRYLTFSIMYIPITVLTLLFFLMLPLFYFIKISIEFLQKNGINKFIKSLKK